MSSQESSFTNTPDPSFLDVGILGTALFAIALGAWVMFSVIDAEPDLSDPGYWPTTDGMVSGGEMMASQTVEGETQYLVRLDYHYRIDGSPYTGHNVNTTSQPMWSKRFDSEAAAQEFLESHPPGSQVTVHYHPDRPATSVVDPNTERQVWLIAVGALIVLGGLSVLMIMGALALGLHRRLMAIL